MEENIKQKKSVNKHGQKLFLQIFIIIFSITILILSLITMVSTIRASDLAFGKYSFYIMRTESRPDVAEKGALVIAKKLKAGEMKIGDNIVYGDNKTYYCDNIAEINKVNIVNRIITAENNGISYHFDEDEINGKVVKVIPKLGNMITFLRTPVGIVLFILFVVCLFALLRIIISYNKCDEYEQQANS